MFFSSCTIAQASTIYRWVDKNNVVHFSQHPPENYQYNELSIKATPKNEKAEVVVETITDTDSTPSTASAQRCQVAKDNLKIITEYKQVQYVNEQGVTKILTDEQKNEQLAKNQKEVELYCLAK